MIELGSMSALTIIVMSADSRVTEVVSIRALPLTDEVQADTLEVRLPKAVDVIGPSEEAGDFR